MKNLPEGNPALAVAHPGHVLSLHGFIEKVKPLVFLFTDGSGPNKESLFQDFQLCLGTMYAGERDVFSVVQVNDDMLGKKFINDDLLLQEVLNGRTAYFEYYTKEVARHLLRRKIDYIVSDASEGYDVTHEILRVIVDTAVKHLKKVTGKVVAQYEYSVVLPYNSKITDDTILIELPEESVVKKIKAVTSFNPRIFDELGHNIPVDKKIIEDSRKEGNEDGLTVLEKEIETVSGDFFKKEYINPYKYAQPAEAPQYEVLTENLFNEGILPYIIRQAHIQELRTKLEASLGLK